MSRSATGLAAPTVYCEVDGLPAALDPNELTQAGAFVLTTTTVEPDRELDLFVRSEAGETTLQGQVVQVIDMARASQEGRAPGFGVLFTHLNDAQRDWLERTRAALKRRSTPPRSERAPAAVVQAPASKPPITAETPRPASKPPLKSERPPAASAAASRSAGPRGAGSQASPEANSLVRRMREELQELKKLPPWRVLDVDETCSAAQAKMAFFSASKQFHPHLFARHNCPELDKLVTELFILHKQAFETLAQSANVRAPRAPSAPRRTAPVPAKGPPATAVETRGADAKLAMQRSSMRPKQAASEPAATPRSERPPPRQPSDRPGAPEPVRGRAQIMVNDALKDLAASRIDAARARLQQAFELDPTYTQAEIWLLICQARTAKADDRALQAVEHYTKVLKLDPQNREALAAVRAAESDGAGSTAKRLFGKLFGAGKD